MLLIEAKISRNSKKRHKIISYATGGPAQHVLETDIGDILIHLARKVWQYLAKSLRNDIGWKKNSTVNFNVMVCNTVSCNIYWQLLILLAKELFSQWQKENVQSFDANFIAGFRRKNYFAVADFRVSFLDFFSLSGGRFVVEWRV